MLASVALRQAEAKTLSERNWVCAKHSHRNLIKVLGSGVVTWDGEKCPFYVMPLYQKTLRNLMDAKNFAS